MSILDRRQLIFVALTLVLKIKLADAEIVVLPKDAETAVGSTAIFSCSTSIPGGDVQWNIFPVGGSMQVIYAYGKINSAYADRFRVQNGHNLHISSVVVGDAGTYECVDDFGKGEKKSAQLVVLGTPSCRSNINISDVVGENSCGIEPDLVILSCIVQYHGRKAPTMVWKKNGEEKAITSGVSNDTLGNMVHLNLTMKGDLIISGSSYTCSPAKATSAAATCNSGTFTIKGESNCQVFTRFFVCYMLLINPLLTAIAAATIWYLLIHRPQEKSKGEQAATGRKLPSSSNQEGQEEAESEPFKNEKHRQKSSCKCSKDSKRFVLLLSIPFFIGLLVWYLSVYRRAERKINKDQEQIQTDSESKNSKSKGRRNDNDLATFLSRPSKMKELEKSVDDLNKTNETLRTEKGNLQRTMQSTIDRLQKEKEALESKNNSLKEEKKRLEIENNKKIQNVHQGNKTTTENGKNKTGK